MPTTAPVRFARVLEADGPLEVALELRRTDSDPEGIGIMTRKARIYPIRVDGVPLRAAPLLKQEMLAVGGDSSHARGIADHSVSESSVVVLATVAQYRRVLPKLRRQPFGLKVIADALDRALTSYTARRPRILKGLHRSLPLGERTLVMGIVNLTPDSFSDGGMLKSPEEAARRVEAIIEEGASVVDLGAESTRPGASEVPEETEWRRLQPVLERVARISPVPISVDTRHARVAARALLAGADLVNDVGGLRDPEMRRVLARSGAPAIVMHMRGTPDTMQERTDYVDLRGEVFTELARATYRAELEGVPRESLLVDPGLGFGKTAEQSLELLAHVGELRSLGYPIVVGASRKSFLGKAVGTALVSERLEAGLAAACVAAREGAQLVRTHDVAPTVRALRLVDALRAHLRTGPGEEVPPEGPDEEP